MGKAGRWLRSLWGSKKPSPDSAATREKRSKKGKWVRSEDASGSPYIEGLDANKHAIAVAAATAAVAEAALAAAHAAAEVVRLTNVGGSGSGRNVAAYISSERRRVSAAIRIQSAFRAYLARRALRALKALVKLQALVRGHIVRKQSANMLRRMQAMARIQARASAQRSEFSAHPSNAFMPSLSSHHPGIVHSRKYDQKPSSSSSRHRESPLRMHQYHLRPHNWLDHWMEQSSWSSNSHGAKDDRTDKILEIDTWKPRQRYVQEHSKTSTDSRLSAKAIKPNPSISSEEDNSPKAHSASSSRQTSNRARSDFSRSVFGDYLSHPNYMANTESSKAKVRSMSVPKQRMMQMENVYGRSMWDSDCVSEKGSAVSSNHGDPCVNHGYLRRQGSRAASNYGYRL